jgi:tetratricopeptide (TPR) repeat protein
LSWQTVIVGDPLCAPFRTAAQALADTEIPIDPATELPALFSRRRLAALPGYGDSPALKLMVRAESRSARGDSAGAAQALTEMLSGGPSAEGNVSRGSAEAWRMLADAHQREGRYSEANDFYRRLIADNRNDIFALNNLAYNLATYLNEPHEALPLATRAASLAPDHPFIMHTLGWIQHLLGNNADALRLLEPVLAARGGDAEVQFHAAVVYTAVGRLEEAAEALRMARKLNPGIERRDEFSEALRRIKPDGSR